MAVEHQSWDNVALHIVSELERVNANLEKLTEAHHSDRLEIWKEIAALKVRAGIWGVLGGALTAIPTLIYFLVSK